MRPEGRGEHDSLYFQYPHFDPPVRDAARTEERVPVAIVGAGPVGLVAALTLARSGVRSVMIERKATFNDGSRAICIARQSFHILDRLGAVAPFLDKALGWTTGRSFFRGRQILEFSMPHGDDDRFLPMYNLQQQYIEKFLWQAAARSELIDFRWQSEAVAVAYRPETVALTVRDPAGDYVIDADWLLAADGARSPVRAMRGLRLSGENHEGRYIIADVRMDHPYPTIRRALFDPAALPGGTVLIHRQPDDIWRIDYQLGETESAEEATREERVRDRLAAVLAEIGHEGPWELEWWSAYSANTLALDDYRDRRVFFVGDSAHIVPIFGVRGLNNGIADGENIGWKLARVIRGEAGEGLLESYTPERRGATLDAFASAVKSTRFMTPPTAGWRLMRDAALSLALEHDFARGFANPRQVSPHLYDDSPATAPEDARFDAGPRPGGIAPDVRLGDGTFLSGHFGTGFTALLFGPAAEIGATLRQRLEPLDPRFRLLAVADRPEAIADPEGRIAQLYGARPGDLYLIRPDMHVAGRWRDADAGAVAAALSHILDREA